MNDVCVHMITRDGEFAEECLRAVLPHVARVMVLIDGRSSDEFKEKIRSLRGQYRNLDVDIFSVEDPLVDLVRMRNVMLKLTNEKWIWLVDDDEFYLIETVLDSLSRLSDEHELYAFKCWAVWDEQSAHKQTSRRIVPRIFKNKPTLEWGGKFGKEALFVDGKRMWQKKTWREQNIFTFPSRYIHFTHIKKWNWRKELGMDRTVDGKYLLPLPEEIKEIIKNVYEKKA